MRMLDKIAFVLLVIGGINWGLVGLFRFDLVAAIFGTLSVLSRIIYTLVGLSAVYIAARSNDMLGRRSDVHIEESSHRRAA